PYFQRLEQTGSFEVNVGGGEFNVAVGASRLGLRTAWVSRLPDNPLGLMVRNKAREQGVDTSHLLWTEEGRVGIYYLEFGAAPRANRVIYDRKNSAISMVKPGEINWQKVFSDTKIFHLSGITPALSSSAAKVTLEALKAAKKAGCQVSYDLNYRGKLWNQQEARKCQEPMMNYVDILISTEEDTFKVFGIREKNYETVAERLSEKFNFKVVTITLRENISVWRNNWTAIACAKGKIYRDKTYELEIVDRVGGGDAFTAGFLYGYLKEGVREGLRYGNGFCALKHSIRGDYHWATLKEVEDLLTGGGLRIQR
ncbi:MAG: sugar kinase, partial [Candidatus Omnitrophica bacterium]|nr:sugar kinase [Candidatus Omnitrophota bacterium]